MKIAVIADDLTGAAEFNGIALRFGCTTYLGLGTEVNAAADVIVMSTDSRSMLLSAALETTEKITVCISCLLYTSPSPRDTERSRMPSSA